MGGNSKLPRRGLVLSECLVLATHYQLIPQLMAAAITGRHYFIILFAEFGLYNNTAATNLVLTTNGSGTVSATNAPNIEAGANTYMT